MDQVYTIIEPALMTLISTLVTLLLTYVSAKLPTALRLYFDKYHRDALQTALINGARKAMSGDLDGREAMDAVIDYVKTSAPEALGHFSKQGLDAAKLDDMAVAKLNEVWNQMAWVKPTL